MQFFLLHAVCGVRLWSGLANTRYVNEAQLKVGSYEHDGNIVSEGLVQEGWREDSPAEVLAYQMRLHFWLESAGQPEFRGFHVSTNSTIVDVNVTHTANGVIRGPEDPVEAWLTFTCGDAGYTLVTVTLDLAPPVIAPVWYLVKSCRGDFHDGVRLGSTPGGHDIVKGSVVQWKDHLVPYSVFDLPIYVSLSEEHQAVVDPRALRVTQVTSYSQALLKSRGKTAKTFSDVRSPIQDVSRALLEFSDRSGLRDTDDVTTLPTSDGPLVHALTSFDDEGLVDIESPLLGGGIIVNNGTSVPLMLRFNCPHPGSFFIELDLEVFPAHQPYQPIYLSFMKQCGGRNHPHFHVGSGAGDRGFVARGNLIADAAAIDNIQPSSKLFVSYRSFHPRDPDQAPVVQAHCDDIAELHPSASPGAVGFTYVCKKKGTSVCSALFSFKMWSPVRVGWTKACGGLRTDISATTDLEEYPVAISGGKPASGFLAEDNVTLAWEDDVMKIYINSSVAVPIDVKVKGDKIAKWTGSTSIMASPEPTQVIFTANCTLDGISAAQAVLKPEGYDRIELTWQKECRASRWIEWPKAWLIITGAAILIGTTILFYALGLCARAADPPA